MKVLPNFERDCDVKLVSGIEMRAFWGLLILCGVMSASHLNCKDLISTNVIGNYCFYMTTSGQRFLFILWRLRFDEVKTRRENSSKDNLAPIRYILETLAYKCTEFFPPSEYVTIDKQLVAFRERRSLPAKLNKKRNKNLCTHRWT